MRQYIPRLLAVSGLVAAMSFVGCGSDTGASTTAAVDAGGTMTDSSGEADTGTTDDTGGGGEDTTTDDISGSADAGKVDPCAACTADQTCVADKCVAKKVPCGGKCATGKICDFGTDKCITPSCKLPDAKVFTGNTNINKITKLVILKKSVGCDLNDDAAPDNALGGIISIYPQANDSLIKAVKEGTLVILMAPDAWKTDKTKFTMDLLIGDVDPTTKGCDASVADKCTYTVAESSYNQFFAGKGTCPAKVTFDPTTIDVDKIDAGGDKQIFELTLPVVGVNLVLKISKAQILGTVTDKAGWKTTKDAMLCGVLSEKDLAKAIDAVPDSAFAGTGFDKATIKTVISGLLKADIDTNGDGKKDAISVALGIETVAAKVSGYSPKAK